MEVRRAPWAISALKNMVLTRSTGMRDALLALRDLLHAADEAHWKAWLDRDVRDWETSESTRHHLRAYGGMGSLNDVVLRDPWLNAVFESIKSTCYHLASAPGSQFDITELRRSLGDPRFHLQGWRCLSCGYGTVSKSGIEDFIAREIARGRVLEAAMESRLQAMVEDAIGTNPAQGAAWDDVARTARDSGLVVRFDDNWLRPCPQCSGDDTCVYRWVLSEAKDGHFVPSEDNLHVRIKRRQ